MTSDSLEKEPPVRAAPIRGWRERSESPQREGLQRARLRGRQPGTAAQIPLRSTHPVKGETPRHGVDAPDSSPRALATRAYRVLKRLEREGNAAMIGRLSGAMEMFEIALHDRESLDAGYSWMSVYPALAYVPGAQEPTDVPGAQEQAEQMCRKDLQDAVKDVTRLLGELEPDSGSAAQVGA